MVVASLAKVWTLEELHSLPDDGNRYELVHGDLFVTPAPSYIHQSIAAHLGELLTPFVASRPGEPDRVEHERVTWTPPGLAESLTIDVHDAIGRG